MLFTSRKNNFALAGKRIFCIFFAGAMIYDTAGVIGKFFLYNFYKRDSFCVLIDTLLNI